MQSLGALLCLQTHRLLALPIRAVFLLGRKHQEHRVCGGSHTVLKKGAMGEIHPTTELHRP